MREIAPNVNKHLFFFRSGENENHVDWDWMSMMKMFHSVHACEGQKPIFLIQKFSLCFLFSQIEVKSTITVWFNCRPHHAANTRCARINARINNSSKLAWDNRNSIISSWIRCRISCCMSSIMHVCDIETWKEILVGWTTIHWWFRSTFFILRKLIKQCYLTM